MKYPAKIYAKALAELALKEEETRPQAGKEREIVHNFLNLLKKNNDFSGAKKIIELAQKIYFKKTGKKKIVLEVARKLNKDNKKLLWALAKKDDLIEERINPDLIAGVKIIVNEEKQFDQSVLNKLKKIFQ